MYLFNQLFKEFNLVKLPEKDRFVHCQQNHYITAVCADSLLGQKEVLRHGVANVALTIFSILVYLTV